MGISDKIEAFILELLKQEDDERLRIQRNELAQLFGCVPSQINYVISTRFSPEKGYAVESRRGGGGYVTIRRLPQNRETIYIGSEVGEQEAPALISRLLGAGIADNRAADIMCAALSDKALCHVDERNKVRADILREMISVLM